MADKKEYIFEISLSVLNHLGRNLYRSFPTVLGEAISNSWDANANNVWIYIDREKNNFFIKDDGDGMTSDDFQHKFLKIGYSKRKEGETVSPSTSRPYIGRKGIGKLALLSCAEKITVISKYKNGEYVGGTIDNSSLDDAIKDDISSQEYPLEDPEFNIFDEYTKDHDKGTIIHFENIQEGIKNRPEYLKKLVALYFRFSLIDISFNIFLNDEKITLDDLGDLAEKTEFLWNINNLDDPYINEHLKKLKNKKDVKMDGDVKGFIASVEKPSHRKIYTTDEQVTVDLFVNGRLREKDILKNIPTERLVESYLYGQIHFNDLDDEKDRFTSSRENIVADDPKFKEFLENLKKIITVILEDWDTWRIDNKKEGDPENKRLTRKERNSVGLYNAISEEYEVPKDPNHPENKKKIDGWVGELKEDATYNFTSYAECFISENLIRKYIHDKGIELSEEALREIKQWKDREDQNKRSGNISIELRRIIREISYLDMDGLANLFDKTGTTNDLANDAKQYKPIRNALMHTALLTDEAKRKLTTVYDNIKGRIIKLLLGT